MFELRRIRAALLAATIATGLAACGQQNAGQATTTSTTAAAALPASLTVQAFNNGSIETNGNAVTVRRTGNDLQGLSLMPRAGSGPQRLEFSVTGAGAHVRAFRDGKWFDLPGPKNYSVRLGAGGAFHVVVVPARTTPAVVTITGADDCRTLATGACPMVQIPANASASPRWQ